MKKHRHPERSEGSPAAAALARQPCPLGRQRRHMLVAVLAAVCILFVFCATAQNAAAATTRLPDAQPAAYAQTPQGDPEELMLDQPVGTLPVVDDARWSAAITDNSLAALIWWCLILVALQLAGLPWTLILFRALGDMGSGLSRLVAWLISAWAVWFLASLELIAFRAIWSVLSLALVAAIGWWLYLRRTRPDLRHIVRSAFAGPEAAFWAVFAIFMFFRWINPDSWHPVWGGEKPMEFAHINGILRSAHFPPFDPWFSDGLLNYYYYGSYLVAFLMKVTGIPSEIAFNLAQPTVMGLIASATFAIAGALTSRLVCTARSANIGGWTAVIIVVLMGNLVAVKQVIDEFPDIPTGSFVDWTWMPSRAITGAITEFPYFTGLYADLHAHVVALPITLLVIAAALELALRGAGENTNSISRHLLPLAALLALALGTLGATNAWDVPLYAALIAAGVWMALEIRLPIERALLVTAITVAATFAAAYLLFLPFHQNYVALFSSLDEVRAPTDATEWLLHLGGLLALTGIGLVWFATRRPAGRTPLPLHRSIALALLIIIPTVVLGIYAALELEEQPEHSLLAMAIALFTLMLAAWLLAACTDASLVPIGALAVAIVAVVSIASTGWTVLALGIAIAVAGATLWMVRFPPETRFIGLLIAAAGCAVAGLELVFVVDDLAPDPTFYRMNTMFKIYNEIWITLGIAASALAGAILTSATIAGTDAATEPASPLDCTDDFCPDRQSPAPNRISIPLAAAVAVIVALGFVYPVMATGPRLDQRFDGHPSPGTLNALDWMNYGTLVASTGEVITFSGDRAVIDWFNAEVPGTSVIAEATIGPYRGNGSRISIATGLPTVIGWDRHERQQRYQPEIAQRVADIQALYNATDPETVIAIIDRYNIEYIIVGDVERHTIIDESTGRTFASPEGLATLESLLNSTLEIAFSSGNTTVYQVR